jgi:hypothetical protein
MSDSKCEAGDTTGFPIKLGQNLHSPWPATQDPQGKLRKLSIPTDFSVQWGPATQGVQISVRQTTNKEGVPGVFQISGISTITDSTTLTYGAARYSCSPVLSIVQNQHPTFINDTSAQYEVILAFQIVNKPYNPSSPDIILLCRPIVFSDSNNSPFWQAVDKASVKKTPQNVALDMSTMFGYNSSTLMPMITYQTCIATKLLNYKSQPYSYGSLRVRVNVVQQPLYVFASENGLGKCSSIRKYTLVTSGPGPVSIFGGTSSNTILQFQDGYGPDLFPSQTTKENLVPNNSGSSITAFDDILDTIEIQVPEVFLGKSLAELASATKLQPVKAKKKAFKCYTVDPEKDIKGDQIMIDPTTGERLKDVLDKDLVNPDGSPITPTISYVLYGSGIDGKLPVKKIVPMPEQDRGNKMSMFISEDNGRVKVAIGEEHDTAINNQPIPKSPTGYVLFGGNLSSMLPVTKILDSPNDPDDNIYFAQDGKFIRVLMVDKNYTRNKHNYTVIGDLSDVKSYNDFKDFKSDWTDTSRYSIKKTDGTGILLPSQQGFSFIGDISKINSIEDIQKLFRDTKLDFKGESYGYKLASSELDLSSSGILPGDIEDAIVLVFIVIGSIFLFSYMGYIVHMWFYQDDGFRNSGMHVAIFIILLVALILFATFTGKPKEDSDS